MTLRVAIIASSLRTIGGAERVTITMSQALSEMGSKVSIFTWDCPHDVLMKVIPRTVKAYFKEWNPLAIRFRELPQLNPIDTLLCLSSSFHSRIRRCHDLVISTDLVPVLADMWYVHFPMFALLRQGFVKIAEQQLQSGSGFDLARIKIGYPLFRFLLSHSLLLANSSFTKMSLEKAVGQSAIVLHPPVESRNITRRRGQKSNIVLTIGRFKPAKKFEVIPAIATKVRKGKFIIAGYAENPEYVNRIRRLIKNYGLDDKVILRHNCTREELLSLLIGAKVYLHTTPYEHFGISIVEGMAARAAAVVHASGGPLTDILAMKQGLYGYMYQSPTEAAGYIEELLTNENKRRDLAERGAIRALMFDENVFKRRLKAIVSAYTKQNG